MNQRQEPQWLGNDGAPAVDEPVNRYLPPKSDTGRGAAVAGRGGKLMPYQRAGRVLRMLAIFYAVLIVGAALAIALPATPRTSDDIFVLVVLALAAGLTVLMFMAGSAVLRHEKWGRNVGIAYGVLSLTGVPIGTLLGAYLLWRLIWGWNVAGTANRWEP
jgi:MFS family permease